MVLRKGRVIVLILAFCQNMTKVVGSASSSGTGLNVSCFASGKTVEIEPSVTNSNIIPHVIVKKGSTLICMCSGVNSSLSLDNIKWIGKDEGFSFNQTFRNGSGIWLTLSSVGWAQNGSIYECGQDGGNEILGVVFRLVVGDQPGPPLNTSAEPYYQGLRLNWTAAHFTGGLPVNYMVKFSYMNVDPIFYEDCFNFVVQCLVLPEETDAKKRFAHIQGKHYSCVVLMNAELDGKLKYHNDCVYSSVDYLVWITAENDLGSANSSVRWKVQPDQYKYSNTVIHAPGDVRATEIKADGLTVSFSKGKFWFVGAVKVNYRTKLTLLDSQGNVVDQNYKNISPREPHTVTVSGLKPNKLYVVRLQVRIQREDGSAYTSYSRPAEISVRTEQAAPSLAPPITSCNGSVVLANNTEMRNVNISWQEPPKVTWNSPWLSEYKLTYVRRDEVPEGQKEHTVHLDNTTSHYTLTKLYSYGTYDVLVVVCNAEGQCDKRGSSCRIPSLANPPFVSRSSDNQQLLSMSVGFAVAVFLVFVFVAGVLYWRCKKRPPSNRFPDYELPINGYTEPDPVFQPEPHYYDDEITT